MPNDGHRPIVTIVHAAIDAPKVETIYFGGNCRGMPLDDGDDGYHRHHRHNRHHRHHRHHRPPFAKDR